MARDIDWSKPLSDEDRTWAEQRDWLASKIEENDRQFGGKKAKPSQTRAERMEELRGVIADATNELARLETEQADEDNENRLRSGAIDEGRFVTDATHVDGEKPEGAPEPAETYEGWNADKLKAEIRERNKERAEAGLEPLSTSGTKAELTERLLQDDRDIAASQQD